MKANTSSSVVPTVTVTATAVVEEPAAEESAVGRLSLRERLQLGFTRGAAARAAIKLAKEGELINTRGLDGDELEAAREINRETIASQIVLDNPTSWEKVSDGRDWASFFEALADFLITIQPSMKALRRSRVRGMP